jgi:DNA helicase II / ATP-dependent DNA helicase PcrA
VTDPILDALDDEQRAVAEAISGPVVVMAGAGTGKTTAVTHRIAHAVRQGATEPHKTLAVTFTNRAAGELRERLRALGVEGVQARTFHAAALRQVRFFWPRAIGGTPRELLGRTSPLIGEAAKAIRLPANAATVRELIGEISWAKQRNFAPDAYVAAAEADDRDTGIDAVDVARVYAAYEDLKDHRYVMDFDDVLLYCVGIIDRDESIADEIRGAYRYFTVDEYQDVSPIQQRLLRLWLGERNDLCVVGDAAQTIYTFAGATDEYLLNFTNYFPQATRLKLVRNYRSRDPIVGVANRILVGMPTQSGPLVATRGAGPAPQVREFDDEQAEARGIVQDAVALIKAGESPRDIAVLVRTNRQLPALEEAFSDQGVPVTVRGGERFFDRGEVREAITRLRGAARSGSIENGQASDHLADQVSAVLAVMGFTPEPPRGTGALRERWESLSSLHSLAGSLPPGSNLNDLVAELDRRQSAQHAPTADAVTLTTVHAAKGLQWKAVFVGGLTEGTFPHGQSESKTALAEEQRLFYVAITRARDHLFLTWGRARQPGGRDRSPSRFLREGMGMQPASVSAKSREAPRKSRRSPAACRVCGTALVTAPERALGRCQGCPSSADEQMVERIKAWRLHEAGAREVPAYVVLTDATVWALAEICPSTSDELAAISGIGPDKMRRYADQLLALVARVPEDSQDFLRHENP